MPYTMDHILAYQDTYYNYLCKTLDDICGEIHYFNDIHTILLFIINYNFICNNMHYYFTLYIIYLNL